MHLSVAYMYHLQLHYHPHSHVADFSQALFNDDDPYLTQTARQWEKINWDSFSSHFTEKFEWLKGGVEGLKSDVRSHKRCIKEMKELKVRNQWNNLILLLWFQFQLLWQQEQPILWTKKAFSVVLSTHTTFWNFCVCFYTFLTRFLKHLNKLQNVGNNDWKWKLVKAAALNNI